MDFRRLEFNNYLYNRMLLVSTFDNVDMASCCDVFSSRKPHAVMRTIRLSQRGNPFPLHPPRVVCTSRPARTEGRPPQTFVKPPLKSRRSRSSRHLAISFLCNRLARAFCICGFSRKSFVQRTSPQLPYAARKKKEDTAIYRSNLAPFPLSSSSSFSSDEISEPGRRWKRGEKGKSRLINGRNSQQLLPGEEKGGRESALPPSSPDSSLPAATSKGGRSTADTTGTGQKQKEETR